MGVANIVQLEILGEAVKPIQIQFHVEYPCSCFHDVHGRVCEFRSAKHRIEKSQTFTTQMLNRDPGTDLDLGNLHGK